LRDGTIRDTVARFAGRDRATVPFMGGSPQVVPWGRAPVWATFSGEVYLGQSNEPEVRVHGGSGEELRVLRWAVQRRAVTAADRRLFETKRRALLEEVPPDQAAWFAPLEQYPEVPSHMPVFAEMRFDDRGYLWVQRYPPRMAGWAGEFTDPEPGDEPDTWWVFDPKGHLLGAVTMPAGLRVINILTDFVVGIRKDTLGVERVYLHRILRGSIVSPLIGD
jgi:hypothetical protein